MADPVVNEPSATHFMTTDPAEVEQKRKADEEVLRLRGGLGYGAESGDPADF